MKTMNKMEFLETQENRIETQLETAIKIFQNLDHETLLRSASDGGWSIAQCLEHLNSYGDFYLPEIKKALNSKSSSPTYKSGWVGDKFAKMMDVQSTKKFKAFKAHIPTEKLDPHAVAAEFIAQLEMLSSYLKAAYDADLNAKVPISISSLVKLKLGDVFRFLIAHNERHIQQALRNIDER